MKTLPSSHGVTAAPARSSTALVCNLILLAVLILALIPIVRFPLGIWFRTELKQFLLNLFSQSRFVELGIFEQTYIDELLDEHISGKADHNYRIWVLLNLEMWYRIVIREWDVQALTGWVESHLAGD